jgi:hypothetical protein
MAKYSAFEGAAMIRKYARGLKQGKEFAKVKIIQDTELAARIKKEYGRHDQESYNALARVSAIRHYANRMKR